MKQNKNKARLFNRKENLAVGQQGFILSGFTVAAAALVLSFVLGYSLYLTKKEALFLSQKNEVYLEDIKTRLIGLYVKEAAFIDGTETNAANSFQWWLANAGITAKPLLQGAVSQRLTRNGVTYRIVKIWLETNTDVSNPPVFDPATGALQECADVTANCDSKIIFDVDGFDVQQEHLTRTYYTLKQVSGKLTTYFKARYLADPDKNISINWYRPRIGCSPIEDDLGCWDTYMEAIGEVANDLVAKVGIGQDELKNSWGLPILFSNLEDSSTTLPPYSMAIKTHTPWGTELAIKSVQPL